MNVDRVKERLEELARIGAVAGGGTTRIAYTDADCQGRELLKRWCEGVGLSVHTDAVGNLFGRLGGDGAGPSVLLGSHTDTVPGAGRYDGCLGVVAALEVVEELRERRMRTRAPVEVVSFACEESARFSTGMIGSRAFAGLLDAGALDELKDAEGVTLRTALRRCGLEPEKLADARREPGTVAAYLELHIDQGRILLGSGRAIGIVTGIAGAKRLRVEIQGESAHAGAALPEDRKDALVAAAQVILAADRITRDSGYPWTVATVGWLEVWPGSINVIPGRTYLGLEVRGADLALRDRALGEIRNTLDLVAGGGGFVVRVNEISSDPPVLLDEGIVDLAGSVCDELGVSYMRMVSMAGHDAMQVARVAPAGMILVRNVGGVSHSPGEEIDDGDLEVALRVYWEMATRLAGAYREM